MTLPAPPYSDGQTIPGVGVTYVYEAANNRAKVKTNDVSSFQPQGGQVLITPDKTDFAANFGVNTPPVSPTTGQCCVVGSSPTGAFTGKTNHLEIWNGNAWVDVAPYQGLIVWDADNHVLKAWDGDAWVLAVPPGAITLPPGSVTTSIIQDGAVTIQKTNFKVVSKSLTVAPGGASIGDAYIVAATPSGGDAWFGQAGKLAVKTGAGNTSSDWAFYSLSSGKLYWVDADHALYGVNGSTLQLIGPPGLNSIPAVDLTDLADLSVTQARNIALVIGGDATARSNLNITGPTDGISVGSYIGSPCYDNGSGSIIVPGEAGLMHQITGHPNGQQPYMPKKYRDASLVGSSGAAWTYTTLAGTWTHRGNGIFQRTA